MPWRQSFCLVNPWHACEARVTVVVPCMCVYVCVCVCVCVYVRMCVYLSVHSFLPPCACRSQNIGTNGFTAMQKKLLY